MKTIDVKKQANLIGGEDGITATVSGVIIKKGDFAKGPKIKKVSGK